MDTGTLIVAFIMLALIIVPVILISRSGKKNKE